jgi:cation diffusion facilitator family transporter
MSLDSVAQSRRHSHWFDPGNPLAERNTRRAMWLTATMMVVEIAGGWWFNSMAVLADGWHMSSHALALGLSVFAYGWARRFAHDRRFTFGTWKIEILGGYTSAILLLGVAALMAFQSAERLAAPSPIHYDEAIAIAVVGLAVNLLCAWWLRGHHGHGHDHGHDHEPAQRAGKSHPARAGHHDLNLRSAYVHVMADAATSVLAIVALCGGKLWGAAWLDPVMGLVGAVLVTVWAWGLLRDSGRVLLDAEMDAPVVSEVREVIEQGVVPARLADLHVWRVARGQYACVVSVVTTADVDADFFRRALAVHEALVHVTVEVTRVARGELGEAMPSDDRPPRQPAAPVHSVT